LHHRLRLCENCGSEFGQADSSMRGGSSRIPLVVNRLFSFQ
jgi:hypothetical protein